MNKTIEHTSDVEVHEDGVIVLGVASVETKGNPGNDESMGGGTVPGISEE